MGWHGVRDAWRLAWNKDMHATAWGIMDWHELRECVVGWHAVRFQQIFFYTVLMMHDSCR